MNSQFVENVIFLVIALYNFLISRNRIQLKGIMLTGIDQEYATRFMLPGIDQGMVMKPFALTLLNEYLITNLHKNVMLVFTSNTEQVFSSLHITTYKQYYFFPNFSNQTTICLHLCSFI